MDCCNYPVHQPYPQHSYYPQHHHHQAMVAHHQQQQQQLAIMNQQQQQHPYFQQPQPQPHPYYDQAAYHHHHHQQQQQQQQAYVNQGAAEAAAAAARYSCRLQQQQQQQHHQQQQQPTPNAYADYVYNPKEARLRKAMREQTRSTPTALAQRQQQQQQQGTSPGGNAGGANRMIGPWSFPLGGGGAPPPPPTHPTKPILSPRQAMAQQQQQSKRDVTRKPECYQTGYQTGEYHAVGLRHQEAAEYSSGNEYEGQKWHPYQNGMNAAYHSRSALVSKMNTFHRGMQSAAAAVAPHPAPAAASAWGQFCNVPFSPSSQSAMMRSRQHMVFLQEQQNQQQQQQQSQQCGPGGGYTPTMHQISYEAKMQDDLTRRLHSTYSSQPEHQVKSSPTQVGVAQHLQQQIQEESKATLDTLEDGPRWGEGPSTPRPSSVSSSSCTVDAFFDTDPQPPSTQPGISKQPLPGFQQAFGSTEIGKFSRSELFASLVKAANVSNDDHQLQQQRAHSYESCSARSSSPEPLAGSQYGQGGSSDLSDGGGSTNPSTPQWHSPYGGDL